MPVGDRDREVRCKDCGAALEEPASTPVTERKACPFCGSMSRAISMSLHGSVGISGTLGLTVFPASLIKDEDARRVFLYLADSKASTVMQIAPAVRVAPGRIMEILGDLERARLAEHSSTGTLGPYAGIYVVTAPGVEAARKLRSGRI